MELQNFPPFTTKVFKHTKLFQAYEQLYLHSSILFKNVTLNWVTYDITPNDDDPVSFLVRTIICRNGRQESLSYRSFYNLTYL